MDIDAVKLEVADYEENNKAGDYGNCEYVRRKKVRRIPERRRRRRERLVKGIWTDDKVVRLISIIERRPLLWNSNLPNYRVAKPLLWDEVAAELGDGESGSNCKSKWQSLRVTFKSNLTVAEKIKSGKKGTENLHIHWRFFKLMQFLETNYSNHVTESVSDFNRDEESISSSSQAELSISEPTSTGGTGQLQQRTNFRLNQTPSLLAQISPSEGIKSISDISMQAVSRDDEYSAFVNHIAAELRRLPGDAARILKCRLTRTMLDFWEEQMP